MSVDVNLEVIEELVTDLKPVRVLWPAEVRAFIWLVGHILCIGLAMYLIQPFRPGLSIDLLQLRFLGEIFFFLLSFLLAGYFAFLSLVPGAIEIRRLYFVFLPMCAFFVFLAYDLFTPFFPASSLGARSHCNLEIVAFSILPLASLFFMAQRGFFMSKSWTLFCGSLASAMIPAFLMHFACMYEVKHILINHLLPVVLVCTLGVLLLSLNWKLKKVNS